MGELWRELKCPYCGHIETDSWEMLDDGVLEKVECGDCEKEYYGSREITVDYSTQTIEEYDAKWGNE